MIDIFRIGYCLDREYAALPRVFVSALYQKAMYIYLALSSAWITDDARLPQLLVLVYLAACFLMAAIGAQPWLAGLVSSYPPSSCSVFARKASMRQ